MASVPMGQFFAQLLLFAIYAAGMYWVLKRFIVPLFPDTAVEKPVVGSVGILFLAGLLFIPIRGGVTTSTANFGMVYFSNNQFLNHSAINPCFSLLASLSKQQDFAAQFDFFPEEERKEIFEDLLNRSPQGLDKENQKKCTNDSGLIQLHEEKPNILIILTESFSANALDPTQDIMPN